MAFYFLVGMLCQVIGFLWVCQKIHDCFKKGVNISRLDQQTRMAVFNHPGNSPDFSNHNRFLGGHGFKQDDTERFTTKSRGAVYVASGIVTRSILPVDPADKHDRAGDPELPCESDRRSGLRARAGNQKAGVR